MIRFALVTAIGGLLSLGVTVLWLAFLLVAPPAGIAVGLFVVIGLLWFVVAVTASAFALTWVGLARAGQALAVAGRHASSLWSQPTPAPASGRLQPVAQRSLHWHMPAHGHWHLPHHIH